MSSREDAPDAPAAVNEELIATLLSRLLPHLERFIISRTPLPHPVEHYASSNVIATATPAPCSVSSRPEAASPRRQQQTNARVDAFGPAEHRIASPQNFPRVRSSPAGTPSPPVTSHQLTHHPGLQVPVAPAVHGGLLRPPTGSPLRAPAPGTSTATPTARHYAPATTTTRHDAHAPTTTRHDTPATATATATSVSYTHSEPTRLLSISYAVFCLQ